MLTNNQPRVPVKAHDPIWDRISIIPLHLKFVDKVKHAYERLKDKHLKDKLIKEAPGILAWLARGYLEWHERGLNKSERVEAASADYQASEDVIGQFLEEYCVNTSEDQRTPAGDLYKNFKIWWENQYSHQPMSQKDFGSDLGTRYKRRKVGGVYYYFGVKIVTNS